MEITPQEMKRRGEKYAMAGLQLTPKDCKPIDDAIFAATKGLESIDRIKAYNKLRGAFNLGWNAAYADSVSDRSIA